MQKTKIPELLTDEEMVKAIWEAGNKYELDGGKLEDIDQVMRFRWIAQAQLDKDMNLHRQEYPKA